MVVGSPGEGFVTFYSSKDVKKWREESKLTTPGGGECPNLVEVPIVEEEGQKKKDLACHGHDSAPSSSSAYLLFVSGGGNPSNGASVTRYVVGSFNGSHFTPFDSEHTWDRFVDFGPDNYAGQFFFNGAPKAQQNARTHGLPVQDAQSTDVQSRAPVQKPIYMAWASNWVYAKDTPTGEREGWRGALTLPREVSLIRGSKGAVEMVSMPYGLDTLEKKTLREMMLVSGRREGIALGDGAVVIELVVKLAGNEPGVAEHGKEKRRLKGGRIKLGVGNKATGEQLVMELNLDTSQSKAFFWVDRSGVGDWKHPGFNPQMHVIVPAVPLLMDKKSSETRKGWTFKIILDRSMMEVFVNGGQQAGAMAYYPTQFLNELNINTGDIEGHLEASVEVIQVSAR